jgi:hypothetical protein
MAPFKSICIAALTTLLVVAAGPTAHHLYETHLSSGYAPILTATLQLSNIEERAQYIHQAPSRCPDRQGQSRKPSWRSCRVTQTVVSLRTAAVTGNLSLTYGSNQQAADANVAFDRSIDAVARHIAELKGKPYRPPGATTTGLKDPDSESAQGTKANESYRTCLATKEAVAQKDSDRLNHDLRATAGLPLN